MLIDSSVLREDGKFLHTQCFTRDITEKRRAHEELRESQRRLATLLSNLPGMAYRCPTRAPWPLEFVSEGVLHLTGWNADDFRSGRVTWEDVMHPEDVPMVAREVEAALREQRVFSLSYRVIHRSGETRWVLDRGQPVQDDSGKLVAFEGFVGDLTEHKRTEAALFESECRFRGLVNSVEGIVWECNLGETGFHFTLVSDQAERLLGYPVQQWLTRTRVLAKPHPS